MGNLGGTKCTGAAFNLGDTVGVFTNKFTLRLGAGGFVAFPVTFRFFADWFAFGFRCLTVSNAMGLFAYGNTLGAVEHFTSLIRAFNFTFGFFAFDVTNCVFGFGA